MKINVIAVLRSLCITVLLTGTAFAQERHPRAYTLQHALAEQIAPALAAQLSPGSSVTPYRQQLILNVTDAEYRTLQTLIDRLDVAPRSLLISVRKQSQQLDNDERYGVQGRIGDGAVQVQSGNGRERRTETRVTVNHGSTQSTRDGSQQVRAVEGMQAFISAGNVIPMRNGYYGERELVSIESGFYATARIVGDEVIVDIVQRDDRLKGLKGLKGQNIATQSMQTQVRGRIGEWIALGALNTSQSGSERAITSHGNSAEKSASDLAIKVDLPGS